MKYVVRAVAVTEVLIGLVTLAGLLAAPVLSLPAKPANVFILVLLSSFISALIGAGLYFFNEVARKALVFFSGYIVFTKVLIFSKLLYLAGESAYIIPVGPKNAVSFSYHLFIIIFFTRTSAGRLFAKK